MKRAYILERYKDIHNDGWPVLRTVYTIRMVGEAETQYEKFLKREEYRAPQFLETFNRILRQLATMVNTTGFLRTAVREEDGYDALPMGKGHIRLLVIRWTTRTIILGNGGFKFTRTHQESEDLNPHRILIKEVSKLLLEYIEEHNLTEGECGGFFNEDAHICDPIILEA